MKLIRYFLFFLLAPVFSLVAQERMIYSIPIYTDAEPLFLNSQDPWRRLKIIAAEELASVPKPSSDSIRKWRVRTVYSNFETQAKATMEVLLKPSYGKPVVFVLPWKDQSMVGIQNDDSNWFIPYNEEEGTLFDSSSEASIRLVNEPSTSTTAQVKQIFLEAWDIPIANTSLAAGPSLPTLGRLGNQDAVKVYKQDALEFSLDFIKHGINGELAKYYYAQSATIYSLETGKANSVYSWPPPQKDYGDVNQNMYIKNYRYKVYDYNEMKNIYPEWFSARRDWVPNKNSFLFMGDQVKIGASDFVKENILTFVVEYKAGRWQVIARPVNY